MVKGDFANTSIAMDIRLGNLFDVPKAPGPASPSCRCRTPRRCPSCPVRRSRPAGAARPAGLVGHGQPQRRPAGGGARMTAGVKIRLMAWSSARSASSTSPRATSGWSTRCSARAWTSTPRCAVLRPVRGQRGGLPRPQGRQGRRHARHQERREARPRAGGGHRDPLDSPMYVHNLSAVGSSTSTSSLSTTPASPTTATRSRAVRRASRSTRTTSSSNSTSSSGPSTGASSAR